MTQDLRAQECTLSDLWHPGTELVIPDFQRSYAWGLKEAGALFSDLTNMISKSETHFIGAIVLLRLQNGKHIVVDGQQRLTTLTMLLAVLRDLESDTVRKRELHALIVDEAPLDKRSEPCWRLTLNHIDGPYLRQTVQLEGATLKAVREKDQTEGESHGRILANTAFFIDRVRNMSVAERRELAAIIKERIVLVKVMVFESRYAHKAFRVLNARGKAPSLHETIKTALLEHGQLTPEESGEIAKTWSDIEHRLSSDGFDQLLDKIKSLSIGNKKRNGIDFIPAVFGNRTQDIRPFLMKDLPAYVDGYEILEGHSHDMGDGVRAAINHLRLIDHQLWRAPALKFLMVHGEARDLHLPFFLNLERFAYAAMMVITDQRPRQRRYQKIIDAINSPRSLLSQNGPLSLTRDERRKIPERLSGRFGSFQQRRSIALRLNAVVSSGRPLGPEDGATVEHVLPRNLPEDGTWDEAWSHAALHRERVDMIGNFGLLSQSMNQKADNLSFSEKKVLYVENGEPEFALTRDILNYDGWTPDIILQRTKKLTDAICAEWKLNRPLLRL